MHEMSSEGRRSIPMKQWQWHEQKKSSRYSLFFPIRPFLLLFMLSRRFLHLRHATRSISTKALLRPALSLTSPLKPSLLRTMATPAVAFTAATPVEQLPFYSRLNAPSPYVTPNSQSLLPGYKQTNEGYALFSKPITKSPNDDRDYRSVLRTLRVIPAEADDLRSIQLNSPPQRDGSPPHPRRYYGQIQRGHGRQSRSSQRSGGFTRTRSFLRASHVYGYREGASVARRNEECRLTHPTLQYPRENDYTEFLTQNSGASNAFTGMDNTCY